MVGSIVSRGEWLWSPANIKGANKDAKIYVGRFTTVHNLLLWAYIRFYWLVLQSLVNNNKAKKRTKHTTKNFVEFHNHFFLLTMFEARGKRMRSKVVKINANLDRVSKPALDLWFSLFYLPGLLIKWVWEACF